MSRYVLSLLLSTLTVTSYAQNNAMEAKAAYLLAEEAYEAARYSECIGYLEEAGKKFGASNAKILYLKVMALQSMAQKNTKITPQLRAAIQDFQNAPDIESFNEEKQMDVMKLKLKLPKEVAPNEPVGESGSAAAKKYSINGFTIGTSLEEAKRVNADFFLKAKRHAGLDSTAVGYFLTESDGKTTALTFQKNRLVFLIYGEMFSSDNQSFSQGNQALAAFRNLFGGAPEVQIKEDPASRYATGSTATYTWKEDGISATVTLITATYAKRNHHSTLSVFVTTTNIK